MTPDDDRITTAAAVVAACVCLFLAMVLGAILWGSMQP